ncbi:hypothetical protein ANO14919_059770 [Xylariales sp. No.14919]|nr:hypothetical protein ANO14919_059770 [Xylariales sp. No.14919]
MAHTGKNIIDSHEIATLVKKDISLMKNLALSLAADEARYSAATSQLARFKLWAGSLGAHRESGHRSLDYRLRDASSIRLHVTLLLRQLGNAIEDVASSSNNHVTSVHDSHGSIEAELAKYLMDDDESNELDLDLALADVSHIVDCLLRLSVTIKNPAPHDQFMSKVELDIMAAYEPYDIRHIMEKFPLIEGKLSERLGRAMAHRRHFFKYRKDHHARVAGGIDDDDSLRQDGDQTTVASPVPGHLKDDAEGGSTIDLDDRSVHSMTSYAPSLNNSGELQVPPAPKEYLLGPFLCPFCYQMIEVDSRNEWKKHVFRDLQPYTCLAPFCLTQDHKFSRRSDWSRHMEQVHWRVWQCPFECQQAFHGADEFRCHLQEAHSNDLTPPQHGTFERTCGNLDILKANGPCPICIEVNITTVTQYYKHVGHHLEQLSLFALPATADDDDESESREEIINETASQEWKAIDSPIHRSSEESDQSQVAARTTNNLRESLLLEDDQKLGVLKNITETQEIPDGHLGSEIEKLNINNSPALHLSTDLDSRGDAKNEVSGDVTGSYRRLGVSRGGGSKRPRVSGGSSYNYRLDWRWNCVSRLSTNYAISSPKVTNRGFSRAIVISPTYRTFMIVNASAVTTPETAVATLRRDYINSQNGRYISYLKI